MTLHYSTLLHLTTRMIHTGNRPVDCKSSIREFDSHPRLHFLQENEAIFCCKYFSVIHGNSDPMLDIPVTIKGNERFVTIKFSHKDTKYSHRINCPLAELSGSEIQSFVESKLRSLDGNKSIRETIEYYLENGTAAQSTLDKNASHLRGLCKLDGIDLDEPISRLMVADELNRTLPERWEEKFNRPHKLRQIKSIFNRKMILLFNRAGWDTDQFKDFVGFIPKTTVSQPFTTDDFEVERIINFFKENQQQHPIFYDIYLLAFSAGLRKSEIYQVKYEDFTTFNGQHFLLLPFATKRTKLKQQNHTEKVPVSTHVFTYFTGREKTGNVIIGGERLHKRFIKFLKEDLGIKENKACHRLRKILGARLATQHGIYHAAKQLRYTVAVAEKYYSDLTAHKNELVV